MIGKKSPIRSGFVIILALLLTIMAACSNGANSNANSSSPNNAAPANNEPAETPQASSNANSDSAEQPSEDNVDYSQMEAELTVYGLAGEAEWETNYLAHLQEVFPNYTFNYITSAGDGPQVEELVTSGVEVDLYLGRAGVLRERYMPVGWQYPLNDLIEKHDVDLDAIDPAYLGHVTEGEDLYMLPLYDSLLVMFYNKEIFDRFGVDYPTDGMTWDEVAELAKQITRNEGGTQYTGLWFSPKHYLRVNQKSLGFVDPSTNEPTLDTEEWKEIFEKLFYNPTRDPGIQQRAKEAFFTHDDFNRNFTIGMYVFQYGWMKTHTSSLPMDWDVVSVPTFGDGIGGQTYAEYIGITSTSKNKDAAMQVIKYLTGVEYQTWRSSIGDITPLLDQSVRDVFFTEVPGLEDKNVQALFYNKIAPPRPMSAFDELVIEGAFNEDVIPEIVRGNMDVNTALRNAQEIAATDIQAEMERQE